MYARDEIHPKALSLSLPTAPFALSLCLSSHRQLFPRSLASDESVDSSCSWNRQVSEKPSVRLTHSIAVLVL